MAKRLTLREFLDRAKQVHGDKYTYDNVNFINTKGNVIITCPEHGDFPQPPNKHLKGQGCPKCAPNYKGSSKSFIRKAIEIHGDKYNYEKVKYIGNHNNVIITCSIHGDFEQTPANHTHKSNPQGCPKCSVRYPLSTNDFILRANEKHYFYYDYSKVAYESITSLVKINETHFLIEFNGEQHYRPVKFGGLDDNTADDKFEEVKKRDEIKKDYAIKNGIPLLIIKFDETVRIFEIIKEFLNMT